MLVLCVRGARGRDTNLPVSRASVACVRDPFALSHAVLPPLHLVAQCVARCISHRVTSNTFQMLTIMRPLLPAIFAANLTIGQQVCLAIMDAGCDIDNPFLQKYGACAAAEAHGCPEYENCDHIRDGTPSPTSELTTPPGVALDSLAPIATAGGERSGVTEGPSSTPAPLGADAVLETGEGSGAAHTVTGATELAVAFVCGLVLMATV